MAVILCNTGIALLAYMDGITRSPTLGGVVLAAAASAGSAVYKVKKKPAKKLKFKNNQFKKIYILFSRLKQKSGVVQEDFRRGHLRSGVVLLLADWPPQCRPLMAGRLDTTLYRARSHHLESSALDPAGRRRNTFPRYISKF